MQVSIDIEALDTLLERVSSAASLDDYGDADEIVVGVLTARVPPPTARVPPPIVDMSKPGGVL
jgi:hypothetical protein